MDPVAMVNNVLGASRLNALETAWRDRYDYLVDNGYRLRPRYRPGWKGSWLGSGKSLAECEDAIEMLVRIEPVEMTFLIADCSYGSP
jgi:hypothetical protein